MSYHSQSLNKDSIRLLEDSHIHSIKSRRIHLSNWRLLRHGCGSNCRFQRVSFKSKQPGYHHFVINVNNRDQQKKDSKKTSTITVPEIKTKANVVEKASALVAATDYGVSQITTTLSCIVIFWPEFCVIKDIQTRQTIGYGMKREKLYYSDLQSKDSNKLQQALMVDGSKGEKKKSEIWLWHQRLGHASFGYLKKLFPSLFAKSDISYFHCDICELAKSHHASFSLILNKSPLHFMTKDEVNLLFQNFHKMIETQYNAKVRVLRSDNGGEYQSSDLQKYLEGHGIIHQTTCSNTPQQNGVVERKNRHLLEVVRVSLIAAKIPISYWGEAITSAAYLINRVPSNSIDFQTPLQAFTNVVVAPYVTNLPPRVFGCVAFVHLHKHQRTKLTSRALQCVFVGYALHKKGYRCYHPPTRRMFITMDVVFHEDSMYFSSESELQGEYHKEI
uniref:Integrase catalytic domain-containing protein n=1 Tax=Vitis vinifera TaxID=29760 RepID=A5B784_VITVI|nr:hypothetical protein VITISV_028038 [Vitis vinifera]